MAVISTDNLDTDAILRLTSNGSIARTVSELKIIRGNGSRTPN